jgi:hypothetical protein
MFSRSNSVMLFHDEREGGRYGHERLSLDDEDFGGHDMGESRGSMD